MTVYKIMLLGDVGVGKTSITNRLVFDSFDDDAYRGTIGSDIFQYYVDPPPGDEPFLFNIWDTDGTYGDGIFHSIYMKGAAAALVVGDVKRPATLLHMVQLVRRFQHDLPDCYVACILNKFDLLENNEEPEIPKELIDCRVPYVTTSAATGENVRRVFADAARAVHQRAFG